MNKQSIGEFLALLRKANGYTQQEVAEKLNISNRTLSSWETDRTAPDILLLPAIADLYRVTVDELLRGERGESRNSAEISQRAIRSVKKLQYGKFSQRFVVLTCSGWLGAALFILAACLNLFTDAANWLVILLAIIGAGGVAACTILLIVFYMKAKFKNGIVLNEDLTEDNREYALSVKRKAQNYFWLTAIPFVLFTVILAFVFYGKEPHDSYTIYNYTDIHSAIKVTVITNLKSRYRIFMYLNLVIGAAFIAFYFVFANTGLKQLMSDKQLQIHKYNLKLALILFGCGAVPVAVMFILYVIQYTFYPIEHLLEFYTYFILTLAVVSAVCAIIYAVKHKKQIYNFK